MYNGGVATGNVFQAIADPTRRRILELLAESERPVKELAEPFRMSQPAISQHLKVLREAGLVSDRREGRHHHYRLNPEPLRDVADWVARYQRFWQRRLGALERYLEEET
jgi:DNA-binding transcriptional ArsR family regulator